MSKKTYAVTVPITGIAFIEVEASSEEEALNIAIDNITVDHLEEWECHEIVVNGNVFYGQRNKYEAHVVE